MTLEQMFRFIEVKEAGKRSTSRLLENPSATVNATSAYKYDKSQHNRNNNCGYCGNTGHDSNTKLNVPLTVTLVSYALNLIIWSMSIGVEPKIKQSRLMQ